ncbi:MFS transporter [Streptomyces sp. NPDC048639]|uniref:MFS transporter n=1 Tax=Streptomyces sp. NPDC048639 TaxID=3365581 RepID=UPI003710AD72
MNQPPQQHDAPTAPAGQPPTAGGLRLGEPRGRWALLATVLGSGMAMLDATVVNIALPALGSDLHVDVAGLQWTVNAYTLTLAAFILLGGSLGDRYGHRRVFVLGAAFFALASLLCAISPDATLLVLARALQGVGGALLTPSSLAIIAATFHPDDRGRAIGAWSGLGGVVAAVGPFLGGYLVESVGWRWIFLINLPVALATITVALLRVPESSDPDAPPRPDIAGALLGALGLAGVTYALIAAAENGASAGVWVSAGAGAAGLAAFIATERFSRSPMMPLGIFSSRQFSAANVVTFAVYAALGGIFFILVLDLQVVAGFSPLAAGAALLPVTAIMLLGSPGSGALARRIGPRAPMTVGPLVSAGGALLLLRVGPGASYTTDVLPAMAVFGLGLTITVAPLTAAVLAAVPTHISGLASGVNNAVARTAGLVAVAVLPLATGLSAEDYRQQTAFDAAFRVAVLLTAAVLAVGGLLSWALVRNPPGSEAVTGDAAEGTKGPTSPGGDAERGAAPRHRAFCSIDATPLEPHR